ncbi:LysR substrate-binding domain-containing protein [Paraburkholderia caballeronis]|uniref:LysR substrate-binding domain-containing protein n=1 Tax=Paraburkholderia caballeronis TaxID=416943 RepID=UPI001065BC27|nr:LysR substrate-binding domain-containing protein [Paraburkholderia caballeronis]TDV09224.1 LysR family transcriptional regulator [Paraburkholderia caballeronis]TDV12284.1 LysR family transcriptional regulator [Paraburkholderia caballeronis]TDV22757.1 LysR family transcriptional regulator [Paraburkholderia caballeronis]
MLDPLLLRTFVAVVDEDGFGRAAARLHLTQSAVSGHLRRLEEQLGKPLIRRTTRSLELTPDGERLIAYARAILALSRDALADLTRTPFRGRLRIGVSEDFADLRTMGVLHAFASRHPDVGIDVQMGIPGALLPLLRAGSLDMVIGSHCEANEPGRLLWREPLVWAAAAHASAVLPAPLPLALFPEPCPYREAALARLAQAGRAQRIAMVCTSNASLAAAVLSGFAIAPLPASQLRGGMVALRGDSGLPPLPDAEFRLFVSAHGDAAMLGALADAIEERSGLRAADRAREPRM